MNPRQDEIIKLLKARTMMRIDELCEQLNVSPATIRRDLTELQKVGVQRIGGGALLVDRENSNPMFGPVSRKPARQIGCILSVQHGQDKHPYFYPILKGIERKLISLGHTMSFQISLDDHKDESYLYYMINENKVDGIIVVEGIRPEVYSKIKQMVPVIVGIDISDQTVPVITYDRIEAAKSAVNHLIEQGHTKIGFIGGAGLSGDLKLEKRFRGYSIALQQAGIEVNPNWVLNTAWDVESSHNQMLRLLDQGDRPTAIFSASDMMAISAMRAVMERSLRIPEDIAFIGLDNIEMSQYTSPPLSSVHVPKYDMGSIAAGTMINFLEEVYTTPFRITLPFNIIVRQSSLSTSQST